MSTVNSNRQHILLTGATGVIGHTLLARLLSSGWRCAVILRDPKRDMPRLARLIEPLGIAADQCLAREQLVCLRGDLLGAIDVPGHLKVSGLVHLAGCTRFQMDAAGDPLRTNVEGTQRLLEWAASHGIRRVYLASTAYAGGRAKCPVPERPLPHPLDFNNDYEQSKWTCEHIARTWESLDPARCVTVLRPSIVVGQWATGSISSFSGLYLAARAVRSAARIRAEETGSRLALRIPGRAEGLQNIVPVDYVANVMAAVVGTMSCHGRYFNIVHPRPPTNGMLRDALESVLRVRGLLFDDETQPQEASSGSQRIFRRIIEPICPYFSHSPQFDRDGVEALEAAAGIRCPAYDMAALKRMYAYALKHHQTHILGAQSGLSEQAAEYFERFLPRRVTQSSVAKLIALTADVRFILTDLTDGAWLCRFDSGRLTQVMRSANGAKEHFGYRVDAATFLQIVAARQDPQEAFLAGRIELFGDIERALKMAMVLREFNAEFPFPCDIQAKPEGGVHD